MSKLNRKDYKEEIEQLLILGIVGRSEQNSFLKYLNDNYYKKKYNNYYSLEIGIGALDEPSTEFNSVYVAFELNK